MPVQEITVAVCGAAGRMGREVVRAVLEADGLQLTAAIDRAEVGTDAAKLIGLAPCGVEIAPDLDEALAIAAPNVLVDFSLPSGLMQNLRVALGHLVCPIVGTTGLNAADLVELEKLSAESDTAVFIAPNFAIGAVLMMQFAQKAAAFMPDVEIIELHHDRKVDSPSGTALLTAQRIEEARRSAAVSPAPPPSGLVEKAPGARGATGPGTGNIPIHSIRLPGFVAHQEVIFGGPGQVLTIRHDSIDRKSFMPGVLLAIRKYRELKGVVVGLENLL